MRAAGAICFLLYCTLQAPAQDLPRLPRGTEYGTARQQLTRLGWSPAKLPGAEPCPAGDARCAGRPEMVSCSGSGAAACLFAWRRGEQVIEVSTVGEEPATVSGVRCRSGCR